MAGSSFSAWTTLPETLRATHRSLFDGSPAGRRAYRPAGLQLSGPSGGEPRAARSAGCLFEHFMYLMVKRIQANSRGRACRPSRKSAERVAQVPKRTDLDSILIIGAGPDRHRPGLRVRLFRRPGVQGAEARRATGSSWSTRIRPPS